MLQLKCAVFIVQQLQVNIYTNLHMSVFQQVLVNPLINEHIVFSPPLFLLYQAERDEFHSTFDCV